MVIPAKSTVGENMINEIGVAIKRRALNNPGGGKRRAASETNQRRMAILAERLRKTQKISDNPEDHSQFKDPPECGMLVPVEPGLDLSVVISPFHRDRTQKYRANHCVQIRTSNCCFSKDPVAKNCRQGKQLPM